MDHNESPDKDMSLKTALFDDRWSYQQLILVTKSYTDRHSTQCFKSKSWKKCHNFSSLLS